MEQLLSSTALRILLAPILAFLLPQLQQPPLLMVGVAAQSNQLNAGSAMTPTGQNLIRSSSGVFAFGFCRFDPSLDPDQFILAIWFDFSASDCTNKSVVWFARDISSKDAVIATGQYVLDFQDDSSPLSLVNDQQHRAVWTPTDKRGSTLVLQDSGNLQLFGQNAGDGVLWESFSDPTDTLLLGNNITNNSAYLQSRKADSDFSSGRFILVAQADSNIVMYLYPRDQESGVKYAYWSSGTDYRGACVPSLFFNESGIYYNMTECFYGNLTNGTVVQLEKSYTEGYYKYMALDPDGTVRVYVHPKNNTGGNSLSWDMVGLFPDNDGCTRTSICGLNSYCTISPDKYHRIDCSCPDSYQFLDKQDRYMGCTPNFVPYSCDGKDHSREFKTVEMQNTSWSTESTYNKYPLPSDPSECSTSCLNNCSCLAVLIDDNYCMELWTLTAGRKESSVNTTALIKVRQSNPSVPVSVGTIFLYIAVGVLATVSVASIICNHWKSYVTKKNAKMSMLSGLRSFTYTRRLNKRPVASKSCWAAVALVVYSKGK